LPRPRRSSSWTRDNFAALKEAAEETTNHGGELLDVTPYVVGNSVYLRFRYDTKDAMGMNMATIATEAVCGVVEAETAACLSPPGNLCSDKKPAAINAVEGRAGASPPTFESRARSSKNAAHHARSGRGTQHTQEPGRFREGREPGFNAHVANVVAAMFLATGQDEAQVVEGANAITTAEVQDGDLYVSVSIASLEVGTVGGGTKLPTQSEGLDILGRQRRRRPRRLQRRRPRRMHRRRFPAGELSLSPRSPRAAPLQRPRRTRSVTAWGLLSDRDS